MRQPLLDQADVFLIDNGFELFVWMGRAASRAEKGKCMQYAAQFLAAFGRSAQTPMRSVADGDEPPAQVAPAPLALVAPPAQ